MPYRDSEGNVTNELIIPEDEGFLPIARKIITSCLSLDWFERPSFDQIINDLVVNDFKFHVDTYSEEIRKYYQKIACNH